MAIARGSCPDCEKPVVYLRWIEDKRKIAVKCPHCGEELLFDLDAMVKALGDNDAIYILPPDGKVH